MNRLPPDPLLAEPILRDFADAVFVSGHLPTALRLATPNFRVEWAGDWVEGELEMGNRMKWSEREEVREALGSIDTDHRLWEAYAQDTLRAWQDTWSALPQALSAQSDITLHLRWFRTLAEWASDGGEWVANPPRRTGPIRVWVDLDVVDGSLSVADVNVDD